MAYLKETGQWVEGIYQIEEDDPVMGGADGVDNRPHKELAARTMFLKGEVEKVQQALCEMDTVENHNNSAAAHIDIRELIASAGLNLLKRNTAYEVGDIAYSKDLPSWARLECVKPGTTDSTDIILPQNVNGGGR